MNNVDIHTTQNNNKYKVKIINNDESQQPIQNRLTCSMAPLTWNSQNYTANITKQIKDKNVE